MIPTLLSVLRGLIGFVIAVTVSLIADDFMAHSLWIAITLLVLVAIAGATDILDGIAARMLGQESLIGMELDQAMDKICALPCFLAYAAAGWLPALLGIFVILRDLESLTLRLFRLQVEKEQRGERGEATEKKTTNRLPIGQLKTWFQFFCLGAAPLDAIGIGWAHVLLWYFFIPGLAIVIAVSSYQYWRQHWPVIHPFAVRVWRKLPPWRWFPWRLFVRLLRWVGAIPAAPVSAVEREQDA